jgi:hypothetical protein
MGTVAVGGRSSLWSLKRVAAGGAKMDNDQVKKDMLRMLLSAVACIFGMIIAH